ncbi:unnamed protein product, partial [Brenthis ino]
MRVVFKYENKAVPTASFAGTEASSMSRRLRATLRIARSSPARRLPRLIRRSLPAQPASLERTLNATLPYNVTSS